MAAIYCLLSPLIPTVSYYIPLNLIRRGEGRGCGLVFLGWFYGAMQIGDGGYEIGDGFGTICVVVEKMFWKSGIFAFVGSTVLLALPFTSFSRF